MDIGNRIKVFMLDRFIRGMCDSFNIAVAFTLISFGVLAFFTLRSGIQTYIHLGTACLFLGCIIFFAIDNRQKKKYSFQNTPLPITDIRITIVAFWVICMASIFLIVSGNSDISRPVSFFISFSMLYGVVTYQIFQLNEGNRLSGKLQIYVILFETIVASMILKMSLFSYSLFFQDDPGFHINSANIIASLGIIPLDVFGDNYGNHPLFHIFYAMGIITTGINSYDFQGVTALIQTLSILVIYLVTVKITKNQTAGLFAALLYSIFSLSILYSVVTTTQGFSTLLVLLILFFYIKYTSDTKKSIISILSIILVYLALVFTHIQYSFVPMLWLLIYTTILFFYRRHHNRNAGWQYLAISLLLIWIAKELYFGLGDSLLSSIATLGSSVRDIFSNTCNIGMVQSSGPFQDYWMFLLTNIGIVFYYTFLTSGVLLLLKRKDKQSRIFALWSLVVFVVLIIGMAMGQQGILFSRYYYWVGLVLSILGGFVLYSITTCFQACDVRVTKNLLVLLLVISLIGLCFVAITSEKSNNLDPMLYERQTPFIFFHTHEETEMLSRLFEKLPDDYIVLTDLRTGSRGSVPLQWNGSILLFSSPSLEDNRDYNCVLINRYSIEKGMIFVNNDSIVYGWQIDPSVPSTLGTKSDKIFSSDIITATMK